MLTPRVADAVAFAVEIHGSQTRKGKPHVPYLGHLLHTAAFVIEHHGSEDEVVAAILHDAVEDGGGAPVAEAIEARFGAAVRALVEHCTDDADTPRGEDKPPWRARKEAHLAHLTTAPPGALLVVAADKLHNALSLADDIEREGPGRFEAFRGGRDGTIWYYQTVLATLRDRQDEHPGLPPLVTRLARAVARFEG